MILTRFLKLELVELDLAIDLVPRDDEEAARPGFRWRQKEAVIGRLAAVFERSGEIRNPTRFAKDLVYREKQASTGVGSGLALPHIRSLQARSTVAIFARARAGVEYLSLDEKPSHIFLGLAAPPYDDGLLLECFGEIAAAFKDAFWLYDALLEAADPDEVLSILHGIG